MMNEDSLRQLNLNELLNVLAKTIDEYLRFEKIRDEKNLEFKQAELYILHKVITDKKSELGIT